MLGAISLPQTESAISQLLTTDAVSERKKEVYRNDKLSVTWIKSKIKITPQSCTRDSQHSILTFMYIVCTMCYMTNKMFNYFFLAA